MKRIAVLGCTGSIGSQTLQVVDWHTDQFAIVALAARSDSTAFRELVHRRRPAVAVVADGSIGGWEPPGVRLLQGEAGLVEAAILDEVDLVVVGTAGRAGLRPTLAALEHGKPVALANKEALVTAGHLVMRASRASGAAVLPVDSEHSAIWQCLMGESASAIRRIILTASGGALRDLPLEDLAEVSVLRALEHPNWHMGPKITIDSATLMNKGLEVLEAAWLFDLEIDCVEVLLHRESIVHGLVEFVDGSVKAQLAKPDMRQPILYALSYPERIAAPLPPLELGALGALTFADIDARRYPCFGLAQEAGRRGGTYPAVLNASNEEAVNLFLSGAARFADVYSLVDAALQGHVPTYDADLEQVLDIDAWARRVTLERGIARVS